MATLTMLPQDVSTRSNNNNIMTASSSRGSATPTTLASNRRKLRLAQNVRGSGVGIGVGSAAGSGFGKNGSLIVKQSGEISPPNSTSTTSSSSSSHHTNDSHNLYNGHSSTLSPAARRRLIRQPLGQNAANRSGPSSTPNETVGSSSKGTPGDVSERMSAPSGPGSGSSSTGIRTATIRPQHARDPPGSSSSPDPRSFDRSGERGSNSRRQRSNGDDREETQQRSLSPSSTSNPHAKANRPQHSQVSVGEAYENNTSSQKPKKYGDLRRTRGAISTTNQVSSLEDTSYSQKMRRGQEGGRYDHNHDGSRNNREHRMNSNNTQDQEGHDTVEEPKLSLNLHVSNSIDSDDNGTCFNSIGTTTPRQPSPSQNWKQYGSHQHQQHINTYDGRHYNSHYGGSDNEPYQPHLHEDLRATLENNPPSNSNISTSQKRFYPPDRRSNSGSEIMTSRQSQSRQLSPLLENSPRVCSGIPLDETTVNLNCDYGGDVGRSNNSSFANVADNSGHNKVNISNQDDSNNNFSSWHSSDELSPGNSPHAAHSTRCSHNRHTSSSTYTNHNYNYKSDNTSTYSDVVDDNATPITYGLDTRRTRSNRSNRSNQGSSNGSAYSGGDGVGDGGGGGSILSGMGGGGGSVGLGSGSIGAGIGGSISGGGGSGSVLSGIASGGGNIGGNGRRNGCSRGGGGPRSNGSVGVNMVRSSAGSDGSALNRSRLSRQGEVGKIVSGASVASSKFEEDGNLLTPNGISRRLGNKNRNGEDENRNEEDVEEFLKQPNVRAALGVGAAATLGAVILGPVGLLVGAASVGIGMGIMQIPQEHRTNVCNHATSSLEKARTMALDLSDNVSSNCGKYYGPEISGNPSDVVGKVVHEEIVDRCCSGGEDKRRGGEDQSLTGTEAPEIRLQGSSPMANAVNGVGHGMKGFVGDVFGEEHPSPTHSLGERRDGAISDGEEGGRRVVCLRRGRVVPLCQIHSLRPSLQPRAWLDVMASAHTSRDEKNEAMEEILILAKDKDISRWFLEEGILDSLMYILSSYFRNYTSFLKEEPNVGEMQELFSLFQSGGPAFSHAKLAANCCVALGKAHCAAVHTEGDLLLMSAYSRGSVPVERQLAQMLFEVPHHMKVMNPVQSNGNTDNQCDIESFTLTQLSMQQAEDLARSIKALEDGKIDV